ncbi:DUF427 domain-containing protein [Amycolatopsis regifaucium]|uniref:DUF427 domain-containing protein n=1 Tax=Amycolatopsis regifaucium TaxID=546365 RepID=A0A154MBB3_9PSEU|nr:DUF427 domain-containing protein [Amycolatopsis regifaucium]KZB81570.1 hypothetical protein AVL48_06090 [Amycolatopsis regifaucium]OKA06859.1 hypothetical protein ATP06_0220205 [Amycolatopsis regifaucium]SFH28215.1 Uncharacterized conserved protein, DUF427 family [Amycolatopsis regifaucium]
MSDKKVLKPSAAHPITVSPNKARVVVTVGGKVVADSANALTLQEANYPPAQYIPRADVDFALLERTEHSTYCPFKGDASYYSVRTGDGVAENAVWTYEAPHDAVAEIKDHVAFYPSKVDAIEER